jgi:hypothetical protein
MTIEELFTSKIINVHCYTICRNNGLDNVQDILNYYLINKTFLNLKNCGNKANDELIDLCLKNYNVSKQNTEFDKFLISNEESELKLTFESDNLNVSIEERLNSDFHFGTNNLSTIELANHLSVRSLNVCNDNGL